jgi:hypothetical protein
MFEISSKKVDFEKDNLLIKRNINLDINLDCFILISTDNANFWDLIFNNILDYIIDKISKENAYNDFSVALESVNSLIKTRKTDSEKEIKVDIIIWILNDNNYIFSNIWKSSCYLINSNNEVIELTNKKENKKEFNFVSSWNIKNNEIIISSTKRLLNYLSKSDLLDGLVLSEDIKIFNKNIKNILLSELLKENVLVSSLKYLTWNDDIKPTKVDLIKENLIKFLDNKVFNNIVGYFLVLKDKINSWSKVIKNWVLITWTIISIFFLYSILSTVIWITTQNEQKEVATENIIKAKSFLKIASENKANADIFELNIKNAEELLNQTEESQLYLNDISKINDDINTLKKEFNKIEIFETSPENIIYEWDYKNPVNIAKNIDSKKAYIVTDNSILWPILPTTKPKNSSFSSLEENEKFIDASFIWEDMYLLTSLSKIVKFSKNWYFSYMDVSWQKTWEKAKSISSFAQNIYLIWEADNQIFKHPLISNTFKQWEWYLKNDDLTQIWEIISISIDGGFYVLKKDLSIIKFFSSPYRIEKIVINKLPKNYNIENPENIIDLKARADLNYVYMLLNNKIWVFKPNTTNILNTNSLTYIWQIEWDENEIKDFFVNHDWEIMILNEKWLYKVSFEISDDRLLIR